MSHTHTFFFAIIVGVFGWLLYIYMMFLNCRSHGPPPCPKEAIPKLQHQRPTCAQWLVVGVILGGCICLATSSKHSFKRIVRFSDLMLSSQKVWYLSYNTKNTAFAPISYNTAFQEFRYYERWKWAFAFVPCCSQKLVCLGTYIPCPYFLNTNTTSATKSVMKWLAMEWQLVTASSSSSIVRMCRFWKVETPSIFNDWELPPSVASGPVLKWENVMCLYLNFHPSTPPPPPQHPKQIPATVNFRSL